MQMDPSMAMRVGGGVEYREDGTPMGGYAMAPGQPPLPPSQQQMQQQMPGQPTGYYSNPAPPPPMGMPPGQQMQYYPQMQMSGGMMQPNMGFRNNPRAPGPMLVQQGMGQQQQVPMQMQQQQGPMVAGVMGAMPQRIPGQPPMMQQPPQMMQQNPNIVQIGYPRGAPVQVFSQTPGGVPMQLAGQQRPIIYRTAPDGQQFVQPAQGGGYYQVVTQPPMGAPAPMYQQISPALGEMGGINLVPALMPGQMGRPVAMQGMYPAQSFQTAPAMQGGGAMPAQMYAINRAPTMDGSVLPMQQQPMQSQPQQQQQPVEPPKPRKTIVIKDKDGNVLDMSVKAPKIAPAAPPSQPPAPTSEPAPPTEPATASHQVKVVYAPSPVSDSAEPEGSAANEVVTEAAPSPPPTESKPAETEAVEVAVVKPAEHVTEPEESVTSAVISSTVAETPVTEPIAIPSEPAFVIVAPTQEADGEDEEDWEKADFDVDDIKHRLSLASSHASQEEEANAAASASSAASALESNSTEFIFPTSKASSEDKKSNKQSKKEKYAAADSSASSGSSGMLDAYVITPPVDSKPAKPAPIVSQPQKVTPKSAGSSSTKATTPTHLQQAHSEQSKPSAAPVHNQSPRNVPSKSTASSSFKDSEESIVIRPPSPEPPVTGAISSVRRSLRPGGGSQVAPLNMGLKGIERPRLIYSQQDLKQIISQLNFDRPSALKCYEFISLIDGSHSTNVKAVCMGGKPHVTSNTSPGGPRGGPAGAEGPRWTKYPAPQHDDRHHGPYSGSPHHQMPPQQHRQSRKKAPAGPMPKKVINDPIEKYDREVQQLLNKISPANYKKLCVNICSIPCESPVLINRLVTLIFEKAITEPSFARLYAELCSYIDDQSEQMLNSFFYVVKLEQADQFRWAHGLEMPMQYAGPFGSEVECLAAAASPSLPVLQTIKQGPLAHVSLTLGSSLCVQVVKLLDKDSFYVTWIPASSVDPASLSEKVLFTADAAVKDYIKKYGFKKLMVSACQSEFFDALTDAYAAPNSKRAELEQLGNSISENERAARLLEIDELEGKLKRRMLGTIKFIGELFKVEMIRENTILGTIASLMENDDCTAWRVMDERLIEIVCKLLTTVGADITKQGDLNSYFMRLEELANDKSQTSRSRFMCAEIVELRRNEWTRRKASENAADTAGYKTASKSEAKPVRIIRNVSVPEGAAGRGKSSAPHSPNAESRSANFNIAPALGGRANAGSTARPPQGPSAPAASREPFRAATSTPITQKDVSSASSSPAIAHPASTGSPALSRSETPNTFQSSSKIVRDPKNLIEEYLSLEPNHPDAELCLEDLRASPIAKLLGAILDGCLEAKHGLAAWVNLAELLVDYMASAPEEVVAAIRNCEPLQFLGDTIMDYHQAPEHLGAIFAVLMRGDAISSSVFLAVISDLVKACLEDEMCLQDRVESSFARLRVAAAAN